MRLLIAPFAVLAVSTAQRFLGPTAAGRLLGLPLTTAPFLLLLGVESGPSAVAHAASSAVIGELSATAFCACYGLAVQRRPGSTTSAVRSVPAACLLAALGGAVLAEGLRDVPAWCAALGVSAAGLGLASRMAPPAADDTAAHPTPGRAAETVLRMALTEVVVAALLGLSSVLGPGTAGLLSTLPVILSVTVPAAHRSSGAATAAALARNTLVTVPATTAAFFVVGVTVLPYGPWACGALALITLVGTELAVGTAMGVYDRRRRCGRTRRG